MKENWSVYILRCSDQTLYTGISNDVAKRFKAHQNGESSSAKYTKPRRPLSLVFEEFIGSRSEATKMELKIKKLTRQKKEKLVSRQCELIELIS